jgi:chitin synthase
MFLAEDRLLCLAIFTKEKEQYTLKYVPDAKARTDPVGDLPTFIG